MGDLTREAILDALDAALRPLPYVDAFWEGGAAAWGHIDPWSDIDLYAVVEDGKAEDALRAIETALEGLSRIHQVYPVPRSPAQGISQRFYRLEGVSPFLLIDLAVLDRGAPDKFVQPEVHGENAVRFDKTGVTKVPPIDEGAFRAAMRERLGRLRARTEMFHVFVEKEINRGNWIEADSMYRTIVLHALLEILRMKHGPRHYEFGVRYVHTELPPDVVRRFEHLAFVADPSDLGEKYREALTWFRDVSADLG